MGSMCCKTSDNDDGFEYESDRQRIIPEIDSVPSVVTPTTILPSNRGDLNSQMDDIVKLCENRVVDVCLMDDHPMDSTDYIERANFYSTQLRTNGTTFSKFVLLPHGHGNPTIVLSCPPISESDSTLIRKWAADNFNCINEFQMKDGEELVVHFDMP